jgi:hypothetical protein
MTCSIIVSISLSGGLRPGLFVVEETAKRANAVASRPAEPGHRGPDGRERHELSFLCRIQRHLDDRLVVNRAEVEQRALGRRDRDAVDDHGVDRVERLALVHDEPVVTRSPPPRARDLLYRTPSAGQVPQRRRRAV